MKVNERLLLGLPQLASARAVGARIARLRHARSLTQAEVALRAGLSRPTAVRIEAGDPGRTVGQLLRYLDAIVPGMTFEQFFSSEDPAVGALAERERRKRVRARRAGALKKLDF